MFENMKLCEIWLIFILNIIFTFQCINCVKLVEVFAWKQISYDFDGVFYLNSSDTERREGSVQFQQELQDNEKFFIQYNNVPIGFEVFKDVVFITVPRRRHGIPSTLNYVKLSSSSTPPLKPYPGTKFTDHLVSVYRVRVDACDRLWAVDTGLLEVPDARKQIQPPSIVVFDLKTNKQILRYELKETDMINERTPGGLTSITVDVAKDKCKDAYAYINDLATEGLIVFSMRDRDSWRINHPSFAHDEAALNFNVAGFTINWKDGVFSTALSEPSAQGHRTLYYHPLASTQEFSIDTENLKNRSSAFGEHVQLLGTRGSESQSGSHAYHVPTRTILMANVARDAITCWNVDHQLTPENIATVAQDHDKLVYVSDLKVSGDEVWVLVNKIPKFVYSTLDTNENNFYIHRGNVHELIRGTVCEKKENN